MYLWRNFVFRNDPKRAASAISWNANLAKWNPRYGGINKRRGGSKQKETKFYDYSTLLWEHNELPSWIFTKWGEIAFACHGAVTREFFPLFPHCVYRFLNERTLRLIEALRPCASVTWSHRAYILIGELIWCL